MPLIKASHTFCSTISSGCPANLSVHTAIKLKFTNKTSLRNADSMPWHAEQGSWKISRMPTSNNFITQTSSRYCRWAVECSAADQACEVLQEHRFEGKSSDEQDYKDLPKFIEGRLLSEVSTWGIGGPAKYFVEIHNEAEMISLIRYCRRHRERVMVVGRGSNCLFDDLGFDGCVALNCIDHIENPHGGVYHVGSGHAFNELGVRCSKEGYSGLEFACGVPGTVGGAIYMNAGANGQDTAHVLKSVEILNGCGEKFVLLKDRDDLRYGYRTSPFQTMDNFGAIISATFELSYNPESKQRHKEMLRRRKESQPLTEKNAGCVFQNPSNTCCSAGALIEQAGLKGFSVRDAKVSELHANFLVNAGNCSAADMLSLIAMIKEQVKSQFNIELQEEIKYIPYS